jgi:hypothetical protein
MFAIFLAATFSLINKVKPSISDSSIWSISLFCVTTTRIDEIYVGVFFVIGVLFVAKFRTFFSTSVKFVAVVTIFLSIFYNLSAVNSWKTQVSRPLVTLSYYMSTDSNLSSQVTNFLNTNTGIPECAKITKNYQGGTQLEWSLPFKATCKEAISWASNALPKMYTYLLGNYPREFLLQIVRTIIAGTRYYPYLSGVSAIPEPIHDFVFPTFLKTHDTDNYETRPGVNSFFTFEPLILFVFFAFWLTKKKTIVATRSIILTQGILVALSLSWITTAILLPGPDSESYRLAIVPNVFLRILLLFLIHLLLPNKKNAKQT